MIPVYICDDELPIRKNLEQIVSNQILILDSDMGPVRTLEDPEKLLESIHNWVGEIQKGFVRALSQVYSPDINPEDLPVDDTDTYELQKAARELDNNWFSYSNHGVYLENDQGYPYFRVIPNEEQVAKIEAHPEKYFILQVYVK